LGQKLATRLDTQGHRVQVLARNATSLPDRITWQPDGTPGSLPKSLDGADVVVNLAGATIGRWPWTASRKENIRASRILSTRTLARAIGLCSHPPKVFISASGVNYYGPRGDEPVTEATPPGSDFLARVCVEWEQEARAAEGAATRVCRIRTAPVFSLDGGLFPMMLIPFKLGVAGQLGSGQQYMPWIHVDDWTALVMWVMTTDGASGAFNAAAPGPVTNREFTRVLGRVLRRPTVMPAPAFALRLVLGEMANLVLTGQRALPVHAEQLGFRFSYGALEPALQSLLI
jgi:uncharacterized protein (TIGR01777 family)